jgi:hypothetical protein
LRGAARPSQRARRAMNRFLAAPVALFAASIAIHADDARIESFTVRTPSKENAELKVSVRIPASFTVESKAHCRIMVLFGGRNWDSERALRSYSFDALADRRKLFLLSLGFKDDDYWEPAKWSGKALLDAVAEIRKRYGLQESKMLYYGYSAGGQCANLFMAWKPELVEAWGCHACGVWHQPKKIETSIPALITCGEEDDGRVQTSMSFVQSYRELEGPAILRLNMGGHELPADALKLAEAFFDSVLSFPDRKVLFIGDDQAGRYFPAGSRKGGDISPEMRSEFYSEAVAKLWAETR